MVGIIVTGHGRFAEGFISAIKVIAGEQNDLIPVYFEHEVDELEQDLRNAIDTLKECEGVLVFTDLQGGSPFKTAFEISLTNPNMEVISGTNLPMLAEIVMARKFGIGLKDLANMAINTGKEQIILLDKEALLADDDDDEIFEDGI
ncbi:MAG: PTS galactosamine/N-acetylgalactosamine transporter subunit IIA [Bacillota bacterium]|nr:PTS galactosamine/N-acetylgalactosamine transporter subunit IIA [Bacillota bacterium]